MLDWIQEGVFDEGLSEIARDRRIAGQRTISCCDLKRFDPFYGARGKSREGDYPRTEVRLGSGR